MGGSTTIVAGYTWSGYVIAVHSSTGTSTTLTCGDSWGTRTWSDNAPVSVSYQLPGPRRPRPPVQPPEVRPWQPKRVLREAVASWATSMRAFAGR